MALIRKRISPTGHDTYEGSAGAHDDLVVATALACWWAGSQVTPAQLRAADES